MHFLRGRSPRLALLPILGALQACDRGSEAVLFDPTRLGAAHPCQLAFEPLATGVEGERLVGFSADTLRFESRSLLLDLDDPTHEPEEPWVLRMDLGDWEVVEAVRTLAPGPCPGGLVLEAQAFASLDRGDDTVSGEYWASLTEGEPEFRYWSYQARIHYERAPASWQEAAEDVRDDAGDTFAFLVWLTAVDDKQVVYLQIEVTQETSVSRGSLTDGTFTVVDEDP